MLCLLYQIADWNCGLDMRTSKIANQGAKHRIWRRIAVKSVVFAVWAIGMMALALQGGQELPLRTYFYMLFAILAVWAVLTVRGVRRLICMHAQKDGR